MKWDETRAFLASCLPEELGAELELLYPGELREIRIRTGRPAVFCTSGRVSSVSWTPDQREVETLAEALSGHSLYARDEETAQGYITLRGGHRMGLCGRVTVQGGCRLREIGSVCVRIACEWPGCAEGLARLIRQEGLCSVLIIGRPGTGKTTLLRDLCRLLSSGENGCEAAMLDERGELAACVSGVPQLDVGERTDVLDGCGKAHGIPWLVRSMCPQLLCTDELCGDEDICAVEDCMRCGVSVLATAHGAGLNEAAMRPAMAGLMSKRLFRYYAVLDEQGGGVISQLYDRSGSPVPLG